MGCDPSQDQFLIFGISICLLVWGVILVGVFLWKKKTNVGLNGSIIDMFKNVKG